MPWNNGDPGGPGPWGSPGNSPGDAPRPGGRGNGSGPKSPWGERPGGGRGPGGNGVPPEIDEVISRIQGFIRGLLPPRGGGRRPGLPGIPGGGSGGRGLLLIAVPVIALWLASGFYRVQPDEQGVVLRFGAYTGTTLPGLN